MSETQRPAAPDRQDFQDRSARNPFSNDLAVAATPIGALANAEQQRAIAEVQARMIIARANPRDAMTCMDLILRDCTRPSLAKDALYQYARGGSSISGPSIRLAESIARRWGNIASGLKEISRSGGYSECVAYAWDLETGYYDERQFQVRHWRDTKQGGYQLTDERDIYELIANMGQRRKRAVLLTVIPGDVIEAAVNQCEETLQANLDASPDAMKRLVAAFAAFGVVQAQIEKRCQCRMEAIRPAQIVQLSKIYASLRDEMSAPKDWFDTTVWTDIAERQAAERKAAPPADQKPQQAKPSPAETKPSPPASEQQKPPPAPPAAAQEQKPPPVTAARAARKKAAADEPPDDGRWGPTETAQAGQPANDAAQPGVGREAVGPAAQPPRDGGKTAPSPAAKEPAEGASPPSAGPTFLEQWLLDENGEPVGEQPVADPLEYAQLLESMWQRSTKRETLLQENWDGMIEAGRADPTAKAILATITEPGPAEPAEAQEEPSKPTAEPEPVPLDSRGGKPNAAQYLKDFKAAVADIDPFEADYLDFIARNVTTLLEVPLSTRSLCLKALVEWGNGHNIQPPASLAASLNPRPPQAAPPEVADRQLEIDRKAVQDRVIELDRCRMVSDLDFHFNGIVIQRFLDRLRAEGKQTLVAELTAGYDRNRQRFVRPPT
jgi:hypothetical protein